MNNYMKVIKQKDKYRIVRIDDLILYPGDDYDNAKGFIPQTRVSVQQHIRIACLGMWINIKTWIHNGDDKDTINYHINSAKELFDLIIE